MKVGIPKETFPGGSQVALVPDSIPQLKKSGLEVIVEKGAGQAAGYPDNLYVEKGGSLVESRQDVFSQADIILQVQGFGANPAGESDYSLIKPGKKFISFLDPLSAPESVEKLAEAGAAALSMELMPRITRAQSMDALSSMATVAGYKAVMMAAVELPRMFPMMMTAAGTITPARVFVVGAGVAGLQAIASSKRLGAVVYAYDVRPAVKEQVESLGGKFVEMELDAADSEDKGGYAKEMDDEFYRKQREMMSRVVAESSVVITTAAIPGRKAPILVTEEMVKGMHPGSVVIDLAAERGGNCELTEAGKTVEKYGVKIIGPVNLPATVPYHSSQMYAKNIVTFLQHLVKDGELNINPEDEITAGTLLANEGQVVHPRVRELLGMEPLKKAEAPAEKNENNTDDSNKEGDN